MSKKVYKELLTVMQNRGGRYAGMDIPEFYEMVEEIFTPEEAEVNNAMPRGRETAENIAKELGKDVEETREILEAMANKGLCFTMDRDGTTFYRGAPMMPGILEFLFMKGSTTERDRKIARLIHNYELAYDANSGPVANESVFLMRVITVDKTVEPDNTVHTYDQVQTYIDKYEPIAVTACYCRHAAVLRDEDIRGMPNDVCMQFGPTAQFAIDRLGGRKLNKKEARDVLDQAEEAGLIHMSVNMTDDIAFICNCDRWHCGAVKMALAQPKPGVFFNSGFEPRFDPDLCLSCETCIDRCPPEALTMGEDDTPVVNLDLCFGCAVCATGCPEDAIAMLNKPGFPDPPKDRKALGEAMNSSSV